MSLQQRMEENGARLNRDRLANASLLAGSLAARTGPQTHSQSQIRPRAGAVQEAVIRVLAEAKRPLQAREIHAVAANLAGMPLSWNTVKDCTGIAERCRRHSALRSSSIEVFAWESLNLGTLRAKLI